MERRKPTISTKIAAGQAAATNAPPAQPAKVFKKGKANSGQGTKLIIFGESGIGKSSLAVLAPKPIFIPLDDGSTNLRDPYTLEKVDQVQDCLTFADTRGALQQYGLYDDNESIVIDTVTKLQDLSHAYMFATITHEKGHTVNSIEGYGFGKGYRHLYDTMKLILMDADELVRRGKNVIFIAQCIARSVPNAAGEDYLCNCPRLYPGSKNLPSLEALYCEWADHILFVDHANTEVSDKKISGKTTRAVFTQSQLHFRAKTRPLASGKTVSPVVTFDDIKDDSIFTFIFEGAADEVKTNTPPIP